MGNRKHYRMRTLDAGVIAHKTQMLLGTSQQQVLASRFTLNQDLARSTNLPDTDPNAGIATLFWIVA